MGLDQYIYKVTEQDFTRKKEFAYLRKANSLQGYFEEKYHIENLEYHKISKEDSKDILTRVTQVLNDISLAPKLFPSCEGFFYGNTGYDEWYIDDLKSIQKIFSKILEEWNDKEYEFYYQSWY